MNERSSLEIEKSQELLNSPQFLRHYKTFEVYQTLLNECKDPDQKKKIIYRMLTFIGAHSGKDLVMDILNDKELEDALQAKEEAAILCAQNILTKERMASLYASYSFANKLLKSYKPKEAGKTRFGSTMVNSVVGYYTNIKFVGKESSVTEDVLRGRQIDALKKRSQVKIKISATAVTGTENLLAKILEGFALIAKELAGGKLKGKKEVIMISWLLGTEFKDKVEAIFGANAQLEPATEAQTREVSSLALNYNARAMQNYLLTGKLPETKKLVMSKQAFIERFLTE